MSWTQTPAPSTDRVDGYINMLNKYGTPMDNSTAYQFTAEPIIPDMQLTSQYEVDGLFAKIIDAPAEEAVKHGFSLGLKESDAEAYILDMFEKLEWEDKAAGAIKWARLYGGALGVMLIDDGGNIDEPVNWRRIRGIEEIRVYERAVVWPDYASLYNYDPRNPLKSSTSKFGMPERYYVQSIYGQFWVHESRCLIFRNSVLPERTMNPYYRFWGMPEYARIKRELRETITTHSNAVKLLERSVQAIYAMDGLGQLLMREGGENEVIKRLQVIDMARGLLNSIAIDSKTESYDFKTTTLAGVKEVVDSTCNMLSAVTNIPQTILFGRSPAGQNSTGESDFENYYNYVERIQKLMLKSNMNILLGVIVRSGLAQRELSEEPAINLEFNPLWSMSETEKAAVDMTKAQTRLINAQASQLYVEIGSLDPSEIRKGLAKEEEFNIEEVITDEDLESADMWGEELPDENAASSNFPDTDAKNTLTTGENHDRISLPQNNEDGGPGSGRYPKGSGAANDKVSADGANENIPGMTEKAQKNHTHHIGARGDFPNMTMEEYVTAGRDFARKPVGGTIEGYKAMDNGNAFIVRFDNATGEWVKAFNSGVASYMKPTLGRRYYEKWLKIDEGVTSDD